MEAKKLDIDIVIHSILIKELQPNVKTYNIMINGLCIGGLTSEVEKLLVEMEGKGCSPDGCTYNTIIRGLISNKEA
ncbi:putative pentatricopeptide repeat-containing protein [Prunus yedoensis var. nudiflora]|uniref:Putative pentatricopeptide repeat-containing protein n=1 Tax=Prunus yedoensis var. nudiflora TaxID=2094558 RepID=A0A314UTL8_PRUYE|nr:putative pentatricopeptide repeat-containing protein [Prunus yedoensis var. nudiflora]